MYCIYCGKMDDYHESGFCTNCRKNLDSLNEKVEILSHLKEARKYISRDATYTSERIDNLFEKLRNKQNRK